MTNGLAYLAAVVLAGIFAYSATAKFRDSHATRRALKAANVPAADVIAKIVPAVEVAIALLLLTFPATGAAAAIVLLSVFTLFIGYLLARRIDVSCGCFGANAAKTVSFVDVIRNVFLLAAAAVAMTAQEPTGVKLEEVIAASTALAIGVLVVVAAGTRRELGQLFDNRLPGER